MSHPVNINTRIIEALYAEGLMLSDAVRAAFDLSQRADEASRAEAAGGYDPARSAAHIALSCEALRTTTRMMHAVAWLINHRAYLRNEITEFQLRRHGRIATNLATAAPDRLALLPAEIRALIEATERFYARLVRLDASWRQPARAGQVPALQRLRDRLRHAVAG